MGSLCRGLPARECHHSGSDEPPTDMVSQKFLCSIAQWAHMGFISYWGPARTESKNNEISLLQRVVYLPEARADLTPHI